MGFEFELSAAFLWVRPTPDHLHGVLKVTLEICMANPEPAPQHRLLERRRRRRRAAHRQPDRRPHAVPALRAARGGAVRERSGGRRVNRARSSRSPSSTDAQRRWCAGQLHVQRRQPEHRVRRRRRCGEPARLRGDACDALRLWKETPTGRELVPGAIRALWRPDPAPPAAGGREATRVSELFAFDGMGAVALPRCIGRLRRLGRTGACTLPDGPAEAGVLRVRPVTARPGAAHAPACLRPARTRACFESTRCRPRRSARVSAAITGWCGRPPRSLSRPCPA